MKLIAILLLAVQFTTSCQTESVKLDPEETKAELVTLERRLITAVQRKDLDTLNEIWDEEYFGTAPNGRTVTKKDLMAAVKDGVLELDMIDPEDLYVRTFGDVAVMTGKAKVSATVVEEEVSASVRGTGIFVRRNGKWKIAGVHVGPNNPDQPIGGARNTTAK